ncbi:MAG: hypothetical protein IJJ23_06240 [Clostridia bacterium]|nr:hypothetical protein [Clostridia bacterium]
MAGLFNSFYYGKAGKADFTPDQLPKNRVELFFSMLRVRFSSLIGINLIYVVFSLPTIIWSVIHYMVITNSLGLGEEGAAQAVASSDIRGYLLIYLVGLIPCMMISSIGRMGVSLTLRNWARDEHSFMMSDIKDTIKGNWKTALAFGFISGFSLLVLYFCYSYYSSMAAVGSVLWMIPQALVIIFCALWWMSTMLIYPMAVTYDMNIRTLIQNGVIMAIARLPFSILFWALPTFIPLVLIFTIGMQWVSLVFMLYYLLIGYALYQFMTISYANACFDRFLNPRIEGAGVNKGLRDPAYDEEDDQVTDEDIKNL